jgi:hypothetical protein
VFVQWFRWDLALYILPSALLYWPLIDHCPSYGDIDPMVSRFSQDMTRAMTEEQFCQVVNAILNGKYSWACLLILQFSGYNPLHYIPYRTYNRLMKENNRPKREGHQHKAHSNQGLALTNLPHLHALDDEKNRVNGGCGIYQPLFFHLY